MSGLCLVPPPGQHANAGSLGLGRAAKRARVVCLGRLSGQVERDVLYGGLGSGILPRILDTELNIGPGAELADVFLRAGGLVVPRRALLALFGPLLGCDER